MKVPITVLYLSCKQARKRVDLANGSSFLFRDSSRYPNLYKLASLDAKGA